MNDELDQYVRRTLSILEKRKKNANLGDLNHYNAINHKMTQMMEASVSKAPQTPEARLNALFRRCK